MIEGAGIADLATLGFHPTDARAPGREILAGVDPAACEIGGGVLIAQGVTDAAHEDERYALLLGTRVVAVGVANADNTCVLTVYDRDGLVRHVVDTLEVRGFEAGEPLVEEDGIARLTEESTLRIFENLTGVSMADIEAAEFIPLRPAGDHDDLTERPWWRRLLGIHSNEQGYADKTGPPVPDSPAPRGN